MNFIKKQRVGFYGLIVAAILALVGMIMFESAFKAGSEFFAQQAPKAGANVAVYCVIAIVLMAGAVAAEQFKFDGIVGKVVAVVVDAALIVAGLLLAFAVYAMIQAYIYDFVIWQFSELHNGDDIIIAAIKSGVAATVVVAISFVVSFVAACFSVVKK